MPLTMQTFRQLNDLHSHGRKDKARALARSISPDSLATYLRERVTNPVAERYLLDLFTNAHDARTYRRFYRELIPRLRPRLRRHIIEGGEISQVMEIEGSLVTGWRQPDTGAPMPVVYKKMPPFLDRTDAERYVEKYREYNTALHDKVGIRVPRFDARITEPASESEQVVIYVIQERVDPASVGHIILQDIALEGAERLYALILREYERLFRYNRVHAAAGYQIGLDGQIPNWAVADYGGDPNTLTGREQLLYLDTNVPMIRIDGQDVVSTDMYFQSLPGAARALIKRLNLDQEVMDRYFQMRVIILDFLGNTILHHRPDLVPLFVRMSNEALSGPFATAGFEPFTVKEVQKYCRADKAIWRLWRSLKLLGTLSDGVSSGDWKVLKRMPEFFFIWTQPIF